MIIKINGVVIEENRTLVSNQFENYVADNYKKRDIKKLKKLSVWLWSISGTMLAQTPTFAAEVATHTSNLWLEMKPIFSLFQEIGMVLGAFAIIGALIVMIFKKRTATKIIGTAAIAVGGVFLVPSAIMLIAIIGNMMNDALTAVFSNMNIGNSVKIK